MFRTLAISQPALRGDLLRLHPLELTLLLERAWNVRKRFPPTALPPVGHPYHRSTSPGVEVDLPELVRNPPVSLGTAYQPFPPLLNFLEVLNGLRSGHTAQTPGAVWPHLIYAYMIENTRIYEIFRRVLHEFFHGEKLSTPSAAAQDWLRSTEELFYRDPPPFSIRAVTSDVRTDMRASRRNAYHRLFGMDLNHGTEDNQPYGYVRAEVANKEFVPTFEELLREVWIGISNVGNDSGANPTDAAKIFNLVETLNNMLRSRRQGGNLSREEFVFVSMMAWLHVTVSFDSPIIQDLRAVATSPEERLFKIAALVGLPAHGLSNSYFRIAEPLSVVLLLIETGTLDSPTAMRELYDRRLRNDTNTLPDEMSTIITHWSIITGRDMKARKVATT
jgi:hypothetical protein